MGERFLDFFTFELSFLPLEPGFELGLLRGEIFSLVMEPMLVSQQHF